jgi:hypothetical protein
VSRWPGECPARPQDAPIAELSGRPRTPPGAVRAPRSRGTGVYQQALRAQEKHAVDVDLLVKESEGAAREDRIGEACRLSRDYDAALSYLEQSARAMEESGDELWRAQVTHCIGLVHMDTGQPEEALTSFKKSLAVFVVERDTLWQGRTHASIARAHRELASRTSTVELESVHLREAWRAVCRAWPLLVEQGAKHDLQGLSWPATVVLLPSGIPYYTSSLRTVASDGLEHRGS